MRDPREFCGPTGALALAYGAIVPLYLACGLVAFWAWGNECQGNVLENFSRGRLADAVIGARSGVGCSRLSAARQKLCAPLDLLLRREVGDFGMQRTHRFAVCALPHKRAGASCPLSLL